MTVSSIVQTSPRTVALVAAPACNCYRDGAADGATCWRARHFACTGPERAVHHAGSAPYRRQQCLRIGVQRIAEQFIAVQFSAAQIHHRDALAEMATDIAMNCVVRTAHAAGSPPGSIHPARTPLLVAHDEFRFQRQCARQCWPACFHAGNDRRSVDATRRSTAKPRTLRLPASGSMPLHLHRFVQDRRPSHARIERAVWI